MGEARGRTGSFVYGVAAILSLTAVYACWCGAAMTWDGAYQYCCTLLYQNPFTYGTRYHSYALWLPLVWVNKVTSNYTVLQLAYGLPFLLAPVAGLLLSWWVVRPHAPGLIVWAIFGVAIAPLPGQVFVINDSIFQFHLFLPVFLGALVPLGRGRLVALAGVGVFQLSHPIGVVLLAGALGANVVLMLACRAWGPAPRRWSYAAVLAALLATAVLKQLVWPDGYAAQEVAMTEALKRWRDGVLGPPLHGLWFMWLAGALLFLHARACRHGAAGPRLLARALPAAVLLAILAGGAQWVAWAADERAWYKALDWRRWFVPLAMPFFLLAFAEALVVAHRRTGTTRTGPANDADVDADGASAWRLRAAAGYALAAVFAAVLGVQSTVWAGMTRRLLADVKAHPDALVPMSALPWTRHTALDHWGTPSYLIALQGRSQAKVLWVDDAYRARSSVLVPLAEPQDPKDRALLGGSPAVIPLSEWSGIPATPNDAGWFDFGPFVERHRGGGLQPTTRPATPP